MGSGKGQQKRMASSSKLRSRLSDKIHEVPVKALAEMGINQKDYPALWKKLRKRFSVKSSTENITGEALVNLNELLTKEGGTALVKLMTLINLVDFNNNEVSLGTEYEANRRFIIKDGTLKNIDFSGIDFSSKEMKKVDFKNIRIENSNVINVKYGLLKFSNVTLFNCEIVDENTEPPLSFISQGMGVSVDWFNDEGKLENVSLDDYLKDKSLRDRITNARDIELTKAIQSKKEEANKKLKAMPDVSF